MCFFFRFLFLFISLAIGGEAREASIGEERDEQGRQIPAVLQEVWLALIRGGLGEPWGHQQGSTRTRGNPGKRRRTGHRGVGRRGRQPEGGVPNSLLLAKYDFASTVLSDAVDTFSTGDDPPLRVAVHPGGEALVCSFEKDCRVLEVCREGEKVKVVSAERDGEAALQGVGEQNCVVFSADGTRLGLGGDDGHLRVLEWPSLKVCYI